MEVLEGDGHGRRRIAERLKHVANLVRAEARRADHSRKFRVALAEHFVDRALPAGLEASPRRFLSLIEGSRAVSPTR
jgi:hypothetical protein